MKRALIGLAIICGLVVVTWATIRQSRQERGAEVLVAEVVRDDITRTVKASGEIDARISVDLSAHVVAKIERLYVEEGDQVEAGEPFLELEKEAFTAALESRRAQLRQAEARVRQAEVELADARARLRRMEHLSTEGIVSAEEIESARLRAESNELQLEQARDEVVHARANLAKASDDFGKTTLYAPISGRVVDLNAEQGEVVVSGMMNNPATKIATVADLSELLAEVDVDENEIVSVEVGQPVTVRVDAVGDTTYAGRVVKVGSSGFNRAGQGDVTFFEVDVLLDEPAAILRPGMSVRAEIAVASHESTLVVPIQAVVDRQPGEEGTDGVEAEPVDVVYAIDDGIARRREVETGLSTVTHVELLSGVGEGEPVVIGPFRTLRDLADGDPVRPEDDASGEDDEESDA